MVAERGAAMREAAAAAPGTMAALLGPADDEARALAEEAGDVWPANYNCPGQVVLSGTLDGIDRLVGLATERGVRVARLAVDGPFHSPLIASGGRAPAPGARGVGSRPGRSALPLHHHLRGRAARSGCARCCSTSSPRAVRFGDGVEAAVALGADRFVELGPGRVLSGLVRRVRRDLPVLAGGRARGPRRPRGDAHRGAGGRLMPVALVTGASKGIGAACATGPRGRRVRRGRSATRPTRRAPPRRPPRSRRSAAGPRSHAADVADEEQAGAMVAAAEEALGPLDAVVLNAGITRDGLAVRMSADDWTAVIDTNLSGAFYTARPALRGMLRRRAGSIVAVSSVVGITGNAGQVNYAAAKAGMIGMVRALAREAGPARGAGQRRRPRLHHHRHDGRALRRAARRACWRRPRSAASASPTTWPPRSPSSARRTRRS